MHASSSVLLWQLCTVRLFAAVAALLVAMLEGLASLKSFLQQHVAQRCG
jgi:hypothetical protein